MITRRPSRREIVPPSPPHFQQDDQSNRSRTSGWYARAKGPTSLTKRRLEARRYWLSGSRYSATTNESLALCPVTTDQLLAGGGIPQQGARGEGKPLQISGPLRGFSAPQHGGGVVGLVEIADRLAHRGKLRDPGKYLGQGRRLEQILRSCGPQLGGRDHRHVGGTGATSKAQDSRVWVALGADPR